MRAIYADRLKEKVLEALAFNASVTQIKRKLNEEAVQFRRESLLLRGFAMLHENALIFAKLEHFRLRVAFNQLYSSV